MKFIPLFPTYAVSTVLDNPITKEEINYIKQIEKLIRTPERRSSSSNFRSVDSYVLDKPALVHLKTEIFKQVHRAFEELYQPQDGVEIYITQSWVNFTDFNQYHVPHYHPNSVISGVYYVDAIEETDRIVLLRPRPTYPLPLEIWPRSFPKYGENNINEKTSPFMELPVKSGELLLFRSDQVHTVPQLKTRTQRISLAFNTFVRGNLGSEDNLCALQLN